MASAISWWLTGERSDFFVTKNAIDWENIAVKLSLLFSSEEKAILIKGRACRERLDLLLMKYREEDAKALKRYYAPIKHYPHTHPPRVTPGHRWDYTGSWSHKSGVRVRPDRFITLRFL